MSIQIPQKVKTLKVDRQQPTVIRDENVTIAEFTTEMVQHNYVEVIDGYFISMTELLGQIEKYNRKWQTASRYRWIGERLRMFNPLPPIDEYTNKKIALYYISQQNHNLFATKSQQNDNKKKHGDLFERIDEMKKVRDSRKLMTRDDYLEKYADIVDYLYEHQYLLGAEIYHPETDRYLNSVSVSKRSILEKALKRQMPDRKTLTIIFYFVRKQIREENFKAYMNYWFGWKSN